MKEVSWRTRRPQRNSWRDDEWYEPRNPDGDDGDT